MDIQDKEADMGSKVSPYASTGSQTMCPKKGSEVHNDTGALSYSNRVDFPDLGSVSRSPTAEASNYKGIKRSLPIKKRCAGESMRQNDPLKVSGCVS